MPGLINQSVLFAKILLQRHRSLVAVVIPIYKKQPGESETLALRQGLRTLGRHAVVFIAPQHLDVTWYRNFCAAERVAMRLERFEDRYFRDIAGYNKLLLSYWFYARFMAYKYMLIYQLDCFVFRDELEYWCRQGYDYIGAPWLGEDWPNDALYREGLPGWTKWFRKGGLEKDRAVGNGGFSLRNNKACALALILFRQYRLKWQYNEDAFWSIYLPNLNPFFRIPDQRVALAFAVETHPEEGYALLGRQLPFGCHAWEKHPDFWKPHLAPLLR